jgi:hypothetical protein
VVCSEIFLDTYSTQTQTHTDTDTHRHANTHHTTRKHVRVCKKKKRTQARVRAHTLPIQFSLTLSHTNSPPLVPPLFFFLSTSSLPPPSRSYNPPLSGANTSQCMRKCQKRPIYMTKEAYSHLPMYAEVSKETYLYDKRGLFI